MVSPVYTCLPETGVQEAIRNMSERRISCVVIVNTDEEPLGIPQHRPKRPRRV